MVELHYTPDVKDLVAHLDHQARSAPVLRRSRRVARLLVLVAFAAMAAMLWRLPGDLQTRLRSLGASGLGVILVLSVSPLLAGSFRRLVWRRTLAGPRGAKMRAPRTLTLEEQGIRVKSAAGESFTGWQGIYEVTVLPTVVLLQVGPMAAHVIPRRAFAGEAEMQAFVDEVRSHLPGPGRS